MLGCLRFDPGRHVVLSLMAAVSTEELAEFTGLPTGSVCRAIPLPSVARHDGATLGEHAYMMSTPLWIAKSSPVHRTARQFIEIIFLTLQATSQV